MKLKRSRTQLIDEKQKRQALKNAAIALVEYPKARHILRDFKNRRYKYAAN